MVGSRFLQENKTLVAGFVGSGLNSNFHLSAHWRMVSMSWFKSEILGSLK